jgi:hypothetical protein
VLLPSYYSFPLAESTMPTNREEKRLAFLTNHGQKVLVLYFLKNIFERFENGFVSLSDTAIFNTVSKKIEVYNF